MKREEDNEESCDKWKKTEKEKRKRDKKRREDEGRG
jgi:hypothetical protein